MNLKFTIFISSFLLLASRVESQNYLMTSSLTSITTCDGFFMDSGGGNNNYGNNQNLRTTICPSGTGNHIQLVFSPVSVNAGDALCFFDGSTTANPIACSDDFAPGAPFIIQTSATNPSGCITVTFNSNWIGTNKGWSAEINCIAACQTILADLVTTDPLPSPADTGWIDICPGELVTFSGKGIYPQNGQAYTQSDQISKFEWDFGDGTITYGSNASHVFEEPGGYIVQLEIKDQRQCKNTNFISQRVRVAPRPHFQVGAHPTQICLGDSVSFDAMINLMDPTHSVSVEPNEAEFQTIGIRSDSLALPDGDGTCYETAITFHNFSPGQTLTNVNDLMGIFLTMEHTWLRDLEIKLTCPSGNTAILHEHAGQIGGEVFLGIPYENDETLNVPVPGVGYEYGWSPDPQYNQTWIEYSNTHFGLTGTLPAGTYESYQSLNNFVGCPLNGDWVIEVCDLWGQDNGFIFSWSIEFDPSLYPDVEKFKPPLMDWSWNAHPSTYASTDELIDVSPFNAGEMAYVFTVQDSFGCTWDTIVNMLVLPPMHPDCLDCEELLTPASDTTICAGVPFNINVSAPVPPSPTVTFESDDNYPIGVSNHPVANAYLSALSVNSLNPATITTAVNDIVSICFDITTDTDSNLDVYIVAPNNQQMMLTTANGGNGDNYTRTCFTPAAIMPITSGSAPFTGNYRPEGNWSALNGAPINGNWTLKVSDNGGVDMMGKLNWWTISFKSQNNLTYTWTPSVGLSCANCPNPTATPNNNTNYVVTATNSYGCIQKDTIQIETLSSFAAPVVTLNVQVGGIVLATWNDVNPGLGYEINVNNTGWISPNNGNLSHIISGVQNGQQVSVQVRSKVNGPACNIGEGVNDLVYLFCPIDAQPTVPGPYSVGCNGVCNEAIQITVANGTLPYSFVITNTTTGTQTTQTSENITGLCPGVYQIVVTDGAMCTDVVDLTVNDVPPIIVSAIQTQPVSCVGGSDGCASVNATGGVGGFTYQWNNANMSTSQAICNLPAGPITVTATDLNGCSATGAVSINGFPALVLNITKTDVKCNGGNDGTASVNVTGGEGPYSYQWSAGNTPTQSSTSTLSAGVVSVTITDNNGCQEFGSVTIGQPANPLAVDATQTVISCYSENESTAMAAATGGTGPFNYNWIPGNLTTATVSNLSIGQYQLTVTDAQGCTATDMVDITQWPAYNINLSSTPPTCNGNADGQMNVVVLAGGNGTYTYNWSNNATTDLLMNLAGDVTYTVTVTDGQGCTGTASKLLEDPMPLGITTLVADAKCFGSMDGTVTITNVAGGLAPFGYAWDAAANNQTNATASNLAAGQYEVVVTDATGCSNTATISVGQPASIAIDFQTTNNDCFGYEDGIAQADVSGGVSPFTFVWSNGGTSPKQVELAADSYYLTVTDANGCTHIDSVFISAPQEVGADLTIKNVSCFGGRDGAITVTPIGGTPPFTYSIDGDQFYGSSTIIALEADDYTVRMKDKHGCIFSIPATVEEPPMFTVEIEVWGEPVDEYMVDFGSRFPVIAVPENAQGDVMYTWDASYCGTLEQDTMSDCTGTLTSSALWAIPDYTNDYYLVAIDSNGCEAEDHIKVHVKKTRRVLVPTGFTPNESGLNDLLMVHGKSGTMIKLFQVFDRWGELLFQDVDIPINEPTRGWDGTFKNKEMPAGVYVWYLEAEYEDGMTESLKGETTLIR